MNAGLRASVEMNTMAHIIRSIAILLVVSFALPATAGKLDKVRDEAKKPATSKSSGKSSSGWEPSFNWSEDAGAIEAFLITAAVVTSPLWLPYPLVEKDRWKNDPGFLDWPYEGGMPGYGTDELDPESMADSFAGRLQLAAGLAHWGYRFAGDLRISLDNRVDISLGGFALVEEDEDEELDKLYFLEPGVSWLFALGDRAQFRMGAKFVLMLDPSGDADANPGSPIDLGGANDSPSQLSIVPGITGTYSIDWFPIDPLVLTFEFGGGILGERFYSHTALTVGLVLGPVEPFVGYEARFIGDEFLGTGSAGLRIWF